MEEFAFRHPFTATIAGPTGAGKTVFMLEVIKHRNVLIHPNVEKVYWCYGEWQKGYESLASSHGIEFIEGLPSESLLQEKCRKLFVIDDLMHEAGQEIEKIYVKQSHHTDSSCVCLVQNIFQKNLRTCTLNSHYLVVFKNPRDKTQVNHLARQMYPGNVKFLQMAYSDATSEPHGYLLLDLRQETDESARVRTHILPGERQYVYFPK